MLTFHCSSDLLGATVLQLYHATLNATYKTRVLLKADTESDGVSSMTFQPINKKLKLETLAEASTNATSTHPRTIYALVTKSLQTASQYS